MYWLCLQQFWDVLSISCWNMAVSFHGGSLRWAHYCCGWNRQSKWFVTCGSIQSLSTDLATVWSTCVHTILPSPNMTLLATGPVIFVMKPGIHLGPCLKCLVTTASPSWNPLPLSCLSWCFFWLFCFLSTFTLQSGWIRSSVDLYFLPCNFSTGDSPVVNCGVMR